MSELPINSGVDEPHLHPRHTGHRWLDLVLALCAIAISVISLVVAVEHGRTERQLVAASTWPFLVFQEEHTGSDLEGHSSVFYGLKNAGIGPAHVVWARVFVSGTEVHDLPGLIRQCCGVRVSGYEEATRLGLRADAALNSVLDPHEQATLIAWNQDKAPPAVWAGIDRLRTRLGFDVCYCSALDECWRSDVVSGRQPRRVDACDPAVRGYDP